MNHSELKLSVFDSNIKQAIKKLQVREFEAAYMLIIDAMYINPNTPEPHNLLGLWFEMTGKDQLARKHYRIAYVLDPEYKPACNNLERISTLFITKEIPYDYGDEPEQIECKEKRDIENVRKLKR